ncbi:hypothetical protein MASR2M36_33080 [Providencia sp.]
MAYPICNKKKPSTLEIPYLGSLILTHSLDKQIPALKSFPAEDGKLHYYFWSFRVMAGLGMLMITLGLLGLHYVKNKKYIIRAGFFISH